MRRPLLRTSSGLRIKEMLSADHGNKKMIVAIDGPAGAGKSTIAKEIAKRLGLTYLDTGAMYRSLTLKALQNHVDLEDEQALVDLAKKTCIDLVSTKDGLLRVCLDGKDVSEEIRTPFVTDHTFHIASKPGVRHIMVERQREIGCKGHVIAEGRDIGTVVFPHASTKIYLDADPHQRAYRRAEELKLKGLSASVEKVQEDLKTRDHKDFNRSVGPLKVADDAVVVDTTSLSIDEVVCRVIDIIKHHG